MIEAETKYLKSLKPGNANVFIKVLDNSCGYIMTCCLSPAASVIYWKHFKTDHLLQLIILIQKPIWIKTMNSDRDSGEHFSLSFFCDYTWQRHKLKRKTVKTRQKKNVSVKQTEQQRRREEAWWQTMETQNFPSMKGGKEKENKLRRGESDTRNSWGLRKEKDKNMLKKMVKPLSLESINHKNPAVSP